VFIGIEKCRFTTTPLRCTGAFDSIRISTRHGQIASERIGTSDRSAPKNTQRIGESPVTSAGGVKNGGTILGRDASLAPVAKDDRPSFRHVVKQSPSHDYAADRSRPVDVGCPRPKLNVNPRSRKFSVNNAYLSLINDFKFLLRAIIRHYSSRWRHSLRGNAASDRGIMSRDIVFLAVASCVFIGETTVASDTTPIRLEVSSGTVSFEVATNVPGIGVKGKTNSVTAHDQIESEPMD